MANPLTGNYEAAVQIAVRQVNGLLATLHQTGAADDARLKVLHSATLRIGDVRPPRPDVVGFVDWIVQLQRAGPPRGVNDLRSHLTTTAPPGVAKRLAEAFRTFEETPRPEVLPDVVRGSVKVQLSSVTISVAEGSTSEVTVHAQIRADYSPDPRTTDLPAPIHGEVRAAFEVHPTQTPSGRQLLIEPSPQDNKIQFFSAPGVGFLSPDQIKIATQVRRVLRESFILLPVDLPHDFSFGEFKGVGTAAAQAIALGLQLSPGKLPPAAGLQSVTQSVVGPSGFAVAVSKEFVTTVFQPTIDGLRQIKGTVEIDLPGPVNPTYLYSVTGVELRYNDGTIDLVINGKATHPFPFPDFSFEVRQRFSLVMFLGTLFISAPDDESSLSITGLPDSAKRVVRQRVIAERNRALPPAQNALNEQLSKARTRLNEALRSFDSSASASFRSGQSEEPGSSSSGAIAITPNGVILRGDITSASRLAPILQIAEARQGAAFTAFQSWIPGGRIDRLIWSWVEFPPKRPTPWSGVEKSFTDEHRFIFPKPSGITTLSQICLRIDGGQILPDGHEASVSGGTTCHLPLPHLEIDVPSWWEPITVPAWLPDLSEDVVVKDALAAHIGVQTDLRRRTEPAQNSLVYFADWHSGRSLDTLADALGRMQFDRGSPVVCIVLPAGSFDRRRRELEARLAPLDERASVLLHVTQDDEGGWSRTFGVTKTPSFYLMNARRELAWKYEGELDSARLADALYEHLVEAAAARLRPLRLAVSPGDRAPEVAFRDDRGHVLALHRLRGRPVLLNFWQSWSAPCLKELRRLEALREDLRAETPLVVALHGGTSGTALDEVRKQLGLSFTLVQDSEQQVARRYGVRCWPTTILIDADGQVGHIQLGIAPDHRRTRA
jgi:peroxiredoxin